MTQDTPKRFFRIYGKAPSQSSYKARRGNSNKQPHLRNNAQPGRSPESLASPANSRTCVVLANPGGQVDET